MAETSESLRRASETTNWRCSKSERASEQKKEMRPIFACSLKQTLRRANCASWQAGRAPKGRRRACCIMRVATCRRLGERAGKLRMQSVA